MASRPLTFSTDGRITPGCCSRTYGKSYDLCPNFPELQRFLEFWQKSLEGILHSVTVAHSKLIKPAEIRPVDGVFRLH